MYVVVVCRYCTITVEAYLMNKCLKSLEISRKLGCMLNNSSAERENHGMTSRHVCSYRHLLRKIVHQSRIVCTLAKYYCKKIFQICSTLIGPATLTFTMPRNSCRSMAEGSSFGCSELEMPALLNKTSSLNIMWFFLNK